MPDVPLDARLLDHLSRFARGRENALSTDLLCKRLYCVRRELQKAREALEADHPVLSCQEGMFYATSPEEYAEILSRDLSELRADARRYSKRRKCMRRRWPQWQPSLFGEEV